MNGEEIQTILANTRLLRSVVRSLRVLLLVNLISILSIVGIILNTNTGMMGYIDEIMTDVYELTEPLHNDLFIDSITGDSEPVIDLIPEDEHF